MYPPAVAYCAPKANHPDIKAPAIAPPKAPLAFAQGTSIPRENTPKVVPVAIADKDVAV